MQHWKLGKWCSQAVRLVRYPPDRKEIFEELRQHVDDRSDLFLSQGFNQEEAVEKTLLAMGDADELAVLLAKIHRPFWGFAWSITKIFAKIAIAGMLLAILAYRAPLLWAQLQDKPTDTPDIPESIQEWDPYDMTEHPYHGQQIFYQEPGYEYSDSGYTVTLTDAAFWQYDYDENYWGVPYFQLEIRNPFQWDATPNFCQYLIARDSLGNEYPFFNGQNQNSDRVWGSFSKTGLFTWTYNGSIDHAFPKEVHWIDICYERDGRSMALRIDLTGGSGT